MPDDGGCWYCHKADENLVFSIEWDAYVHPACVREALERDPQDDEAWVFARELGIAAEIITELPALRRVAEAAERARRHGFGSLTDWGESCHVVPLSHWMPLLDALADWRRVRGE